MLISELIKTLKKIEAVYGDRNVMISTPESNYMAGITNVDMFQHPVTGTSNCAMIEFSHKELKDILR